MGMSLSAKLVYGVSFGSEDEWYDNFPEDSDFTEEDHDEWLAEHFCGISRPTSQYEENKEEHSEYWSKKWDAVREYPIEIDTSHCQEYTCDLGVYLKETEQGADYGARMIDLSKLEEPSEEMKQKLLEVVNKTGYTGEVKMGWYIIPQYW